MVDRKRLLSKYGTERDWCISCARFRGPPNFHGYCRERFGGVSATPTRCLDKIPTLPTIEHKQHHHDERNPDSPRKDASFGAIGIPKIEIDQRQ